MPQDPIIAPEGSAWPDEAALADAVAELEAALGTTLPEPYRSFLLTYGGGAPYPLIFDYAPDEDDPERFLDRLNRPARVQELFTGKTFGDGTPQGFAAIGEDPGGLIVLLSLHPGDFGAIYAWSATAEPWGGPNNSPDMLVHLGADFGAFMASLYETEDLMGYEHWSTPQRRALKRDLVLP